MTDPKDFKLSEWAATQEFDDFDNHCAVDDAINATWNKAIEVAENLKQNSELIPIIYMQPGFIKGMELIIKTLKECAKR